MRKTSNFYSCPDCESYGSETYDDSHGNDALSYAEKLVDACDDMEIDGYLQFIKDIRQYPLLSKNEETEKFQALRTLVPNSREYQKIQDEILNSNLRLVIKIVSREFRNQATVIMGFQDMIQEGTLGLSKAISKFDVTQGNRFSTYATHWIRQSIQRAMADHGMNYRIAPGKHGKLRKVMAIRNRMGDELGRMPTMKELALECSLRIEDVEELVNIAVPAFSIDRIINTDSRVMGGETEVTLGSKIADEAVSHIEDDIIGHIEQQRILDIARKCLNETAYAVFAARHLYDKPESYESIGARLGYSRERIRQIDTKAVKAVQYVYQNGHIPPSQKANG